MRITTVVLALLAIQLSASVAPAAPEAEDEVVAVNVERLHALATGNMQTLEHLFADDFIYVTPTGKVETKEDFRKSIAGGYKLAFVEPENLRVRVHGTAAVVTYTTRRAASAATSPVESISTCVYVRDPQAGWQLVSQQTNRISR